MSGASPPFLRHLLPLRQREPPAQAGTEDPQELVILRRDHFTIETQSVDARLTPTLRIVVTASEQPIFERAAGRFEVLLASR